MKTRTDAHDDVALRDEETITWWAMMHNMDDDRVPCTRVSKSCKAEARWSYQCPYCLGQARLCTPHRQEVDGMWQSACGDCGIAIPAPIPWLPM